MDVQINRNQQSTTVFRAGSYVLGTTEEPQFDIDTYMSVCNGVDSVHRATLAFKLDELFLNLSH